MKQISIDSANADIRLLEEAEVAAVSGALAVMTEPVKWYHVGDGLFLGFNEKTGLYAGWGHLK